MTRRQALTSAAALVGLPVVGKAAAKPALLNQFNAACERVFASGAWKGTTQHFLVTDIEGWKKASESGWDGYRHGKIKDGRIEA